jgi:hypothetical protein
MPARDQRPRRHTPCRCLPETNTPYRTRNMVNHAKSRLGVCRGMSTSAFAQSARPVIPFELARLPSSRSGQ